MRGEAEAAAAKMHASVVQAQGELTEAKAERARVVTSLEERLGAAESGAAASLAELGKKAQDGVAEAQESARVTREKAATEVRNAQQELRKQLLAAKEGQKLAQAAESKLREQQTQLEATTSEHGDLKRKHETIAKRLIASDKERKLYMEARPSPILSLCTHFARAGIEWRR